jgi:hypothetical protein
MLFIWWVIVSVFAGQWQVEGGVGQERTDPRLTGLDSGDHVGELGAYDGLRVEGLAECDALV